MTTEGEIRIETVEDAVAAEVEWEDWLGCVLVGDCLPRFTDSTMCKSPFKTHHLGHLEAFSRHLFCKSKFIYIYILAIWSDEIVTAGPHAFDDYTV